MACRTSAAPRRLRVPPGYPPQVLLAPWDPSFLHKALTRLVDLVNHVANCERQRRPKTSQDERICSICSQTFKKAEHLARHIRSHTKERPFTCDVCGKFYARQYVSYIYSVV